MDSSNDKSLTRLIRAIAAISLLLIAGQANAQSSIVVTWRRLAEVASPRIQALVPSRFLTGFENGEISVIASNSRRTAYVVAKNGISLNITSTVGTLTDRANRFFRSEREASSLPAIENFPRTQYDASQLIEIVNDSPDAMLNPWAVQDIQRGAERRATLSNGKTAYYIYQQSGRQGWCVITHESERYSDFTCVNIANSPKAAFTVLNSLPIPTR